MGKKPLILLGILIPAAVIALIFTTSNGSIITNPFAFPTPYPTIAANSEPMPEFISMAPSSSLNIEVLSPRSGDNITSGFVVKGNARTFESNVAIRLSDSAGNLLTETFTLANAPDAGQFGPFEKELIFQTDSETGTLEVFQYSAKDGSEIDKVTIPLLFGK